MQLVAVQAGAAIGGAAAAEVARPWLIARALDLAVAIFATVCKWVVATFVSVSTVVAIPSAVSSVVGFWWATMTSIPTLLLAGGTVSNAMLGLVSGTLLPELIATTAEVFPEASLPRATLYGFAAAANAARNVGARALGAVGPSTSSLGNASWLAIILNVIGWGVTMVVLLVAIVLLIHCRRFYSSSLSVRSAGAREASREAGSADDAREDAREELIF